VREVREICKITPSPPSSIISCTKLSSNRGVHSILGTTIFQKKIRKRREREVREREVRERGEREREVRERGERKRRDERRKKNK
jgi:hypothetical protein